MRRLIPLAALALGLAGCGGGSVTTPFPETVIGKVKAGASGSAAGKALFAAKKWPVKSAIFMPIAEFSNAVRHRCSLCWRA